MLETEIKRLSDNIAHLSKLLEAMAETSKIQASSTPETPASNPAPEEAEPATEKSEDGFTQSDVKSLAMLIAKKDRSKRDDIKAKLAEFDAKVINDLGHDNLQVVAAWMTDLKESIGA